MLDKLFWDDPYSSEIQAKIASVEGDGIYLDQTIFYAFSGGQESDFGTIGGVEVLEATKEGTNIRYTLASEHDLHVGQEVAVKIDWQRRYSLMQHHFAAELILELLYQELGSVEKIGAHIAQDKARIDFFWQENISNLFPLLLHKATELINKNLPIKSDYSDLANQRRYWEIDGFAQVPCGGTHLKHTGEVGRLCLKRKNIGKGKERIEIYVNQ
ncbi:alanyl-tRNA editing protein [Sulfurospirillum diekertiae]|uniref:Alanyl-tRNA editing protein n=1 Tax=Sulfurospirillum diekertiae TaxID=1854492 RepID=A0A6G9VUB7_9BACT|nr:alanyl-tRNA editing protein [Sulfurospirillum diekertiae]QIR76770.1 alanyl-tRNA editing protein [Sulfurospirillum diekertiae]QIR79401.1 alanyl-tRNA editing protein [Sulfurospirillum diekertiae]